MSQTMSNEIQTIHYCTILSAGQWDFLLEGRFSPLRQKCLYRLMNGAVRTRTAYRIKGIDIVLEVGQVAASDVELADFLDCNRKTVGKLIDSFNRLGMLTTRTNNRTSVHSLHFSHWLVCRRCPCHQSPLCQTLGYRQRTDGRCADTYFRQSAVRG